MTVPDLVVENLSLRLGEFRLRNLNLALEAGEILAILGPNGAGKSVTLEAIAGFHRQDAGRIRIRQRDVTVLAPEHRNVGLMFQNFGLFPHLTVAQNVAFGLRARHRAPLTGTLDEIEALSVQFGIAHLKDRQPPGLSPGEKQRVALARAFATHPDLFLFDEPFSALDTRTRETLRGELLAFLRRTQITAIIVTHDHTDAMTLADKVAVIRHGEIVQSGAVTEIFHKPKDVFVAEFVGMENLLDGGISSEAGGLRAVAIGGATLYSASGGAEWRRGQKVKVGIRAEDIGVFPMSPGRSDRNPEINNIAARIVAITRSRPLCEIEFDCGFPLRAYAMARHIREMNLTTGGQASLEIAADAVHLMPMAG
ncbi:MAG TPA: ABC transporter ATP-binding protein [Stellaceae bacterium]|nr:ABC transporter ATP-binding protein [Stellaceae bacterium]